MRRNYALEPKEVDAGFVLTCQTLPVSDEVTVDFDSLGSAMSVLPSYVRGGWVTPATRPTGRPMTDAVTGEEVGRLATDGIDMAAVAAYGRDTGGPALRELTFHQRPRCSRPWPGTCASTARSSTRSRRAPARRRGTRSSTSTAASACWRPTRRMGKRELPHRDRRLDGDRPAARARVARSSASTC